MKIDGNMSIQNVFKISSNLRLGVLINLVLIRKKSVGSNSFFILVNICSLFVFGERNIFVTIISNIFLFLKTFFV